MTVGVVLMLRSYSPIASGSVIKESHGPISGQTVQAGIPGPWRKRETQGRRKGFTGLLMEKG